ncbi:MFS transporter [Elongatibacter sediminis]|uniref:MFS transporter n=1 Tax=Elongatibacter sediminis TaxID=3119006 RepID=A0AAW9RE90_9GAMM
MKNQFAGVAPPVAVNIAVAVVAGAPAFSNLSSFLFAAWAAGRDKLTFLSRLMAAMGLFLALLALPPASAGGLVAFCALTVLARTAWSGILTVRAAVWRANYRRDWRAQVTGRIVQLASLLVAGYAALIGFLMDGSPMAYRPAFVVGALCALAAARVYRNARVRRHRQLLAAELAEQTLEGRRLDPSVFKRVLRGDDDFRHYMLSMMVFGSGNLMVIPMVVVMLNEQMELSRLYQVMVTSSVPLLVLCFSIRIWARLLDQRHIFSYRAVHSWFFVASFAVFALALGLRSPALLWPASILLGAAYAGAHLGWNLGHNDFSSDAQASHYMAIHVTFTGLRGLIMPLAGVGFYQFLAARWPQQAPLALLLPVSLSLAGSLSFVFLHFARAKRLREAGS